MHMVDVHVGCGDAMVDRLAIATLHAFLELVVRACKRFRSLVWACMRASVCCVQTLSTFLFHSSTHMAQYWMQPASGQHQSSDMANSGAGEHHLSPTAFVSQTATTIVATTHTAANVVPLCQPGGLAVPPPAPSLFYPGSMHVPMFAPGPPPPPQQQPQQFVYAHPQLYQLTPGGSAFPTGGLLYPPSASAGAGFGVAMQYGAPPAPYFSANGLVMSAHGGPGAASAVHAAYHPAAGAWPADFRQPFISNPSVAPGASQLGRVAYAGHSAAASPATYAGDVKVESVPQHGNDEAPAAGEGDAPGDGDAVDEDSGGGHNPAFPAKRIRRRGNNAFTAAPGEIRKCRFCPYSSESPINVTRHERSHTGLKPFACTHCSYRSARSDDLAKHILRHSAKAVDKPFKCTKCPYATIDVSNYRRHERSHERKEERRQRKEAALQVRDWDIRSCSHRFAVSIVPAHSECLSIPPARRCSPLAPHVVCLHS
jgi:hypothetical protein